MDFQRLEYEIRKKGVTVTALCRETGISRSAYYQTRRGAREFTHGEMLALSRRLCLRDPGSVFFCRKVS